MVTEQGISPMWLIRLDLWPFWWTKYAVDTLDVALARQRNLPLLPYPWCPLLPNRLKPQPWLVG